MEDILLAFGNADDEVWERNVSFSRVEEDGVARGQGVMLHGKE